MSLAVPPHRYRSVFRDPSASPCPPCPEQARGSPHPNPSGRRGGSRTRGLRLLIPRSSIAPWRRRRPRGGRGVMTSVARRRCRRRCRAWPSSAPSPPSPSAWRPPRSSRPCTRLTRGTSASTTGETARRGSLRGESRVPASRRRSRFPPSLSLPFPPQRRSVADLHQRARLPPHAALHHVLQVSAGAAGRGPGRGGHRGAPGLLWPCPVPGTGGSRAIGAGKSLC